MLVSLKERPDLALAGVKIKVELPTKWIGASSDENTVLCPAYITRVVRNHDDDKILCINFNVLYSKKYKNSSVQNMECYASSLDTVFVEVAKYKDFEERKVQKAVTKGDTTKYDVHKIQGIYL